MKIFSSFFIDVQKKLLFHTNFVFNAYMKSFNVDNNRARATQSCEFVVNQGCHAPLFQITFEQRTVTVAFWRKHIGKFIVSTAQVEQSAPIQWHPMCHFRSNVHIVHIHWLLEFSVFDSIVSFEHLLITSSQPFHFHHQKSTVGSNANSEPTDTEFLHGEKGKECVL